MAIVSLTLRRVVARRSSWAALSRCLETVRACIAQTGQGPRQEVLVDQRAGHAKTPQQIAAASNGGVPAKADEGQAARSSAGAASKDAISAACGTPSAAAAIRRCVRTASAVPIAIPTRTPMTLGMPT